MGFISDITRSVTKPFKKIIKSPAGIAAILALGVPAYAKYGSAAGWPGAKGILGSGSKMAGLGDWLYGTTTPGTGAFQGPLGMSKNMMTKTPGLWGRSGTLGKSAIVGGATAGLTAAGLPDEEDLPEELTDDSGQQQYLANRALYEDEWSDWLMDMNPGMSKAEALEEVRSKPMFSEGGRVKAQGGLFAGQMPGRHPGMNQGNPMGMNQGLGAPNLGSRSMGMTPGMGQQPMDPRMAQMMQAQKLQGGPRRAVPKESEDTELIQLIKMLTALGIPMEQLRGRTKEELVEMLVSVSGKGKGGTEIIEGEAIEESNGEEVEAAEEEVIQAAHGGRIGMADGRDKEDLMGGAIGGRQALAARASQSQSQRAATDRAINKATGTVTPNDVPVSNISNRDQYNITKRNRFLQNLPQSRIDQLIRQGLMIEGEEEDYFEPRWAGDIASPESLRQFQGLGYQGGINPPGTGGPGHTTPSYTTAGGGAGTTADTTGDDYYKFAEWDKWLMPGETATQPLMPGGYKKQILAKQGGLMRTGYALGHPVIPSKDGMQLDMRDKGGYQPHGKAEKHDDVRALLAQGEFVMTSDAVKGMGGGDREVGAKKMYNLMHNMEAMA